MSSKSKIDIGPNEIISPIATLIGLLVVAVGFLHSSQFSGGEVGSLTNVILSITFVFIITVLIAIGYVFTGSRMLWSLSIRFYLASWAVFGIGIIVIFSLLGYGNITYYSYAWFSINLIFLTQLSALMISLLAFFTYILSPEYSLLFYLRKCQGSPMNQLRLRDEAEHILKINQGRGEVALVETCERVEALVSKIIESDSGDINNKDYYKVLIKNIWKSKQIEKTGGPFAQSAMEGIIRLHISVGSKLVDDFVAEIGIRAGLLLLKELGQGVETNPASKSREKNLSL